MKQTCHSEFGKIKLVFIKKAENAFINDQKIGSEWQSLNFLSKPNLQSATQEYSTFENLLKKDGAEVSHFPESGNLTLDSIYCRDASIATDFGMIICNMGKPAREHEPAAQQAYFEKSGIKILGVIQSPGTVEGGDVAWLDGKTLAIGHTYRTNKNGIDQIKQLLAPHGVNIITVDLPHYKGSSDVFHLMSILSPVDKNLAVVYSPLMPISFRNELLDRGFDLVEVQDAEFETMGCNVLAIAPRECLIVKGNPNTKMKLEKTGCTVHEYDGHDISMKGGGGPTCLTRPIERMVES
jgi:N-dimethylarginine dimethylaminohydrolase